MADEKKIVTQDIFEKAISDVLQIVAENTFDFVEYESGEVDALFDVESPEKLAYYESLINPDLISENRLWSSKTISDKLQQLQLDCNSYADEIATRNLTTEIVTATSEVTKENVLYLILSDSSTNTYEQYMLIRGTATPLGSTKIDLSDIYTKSEMDTKLNDKANKSEVLAVNKVQTTTGSETHDNVYSAKLIKTELDKKANDSEVIKKTDISTTIDSTSTDDKVPSAKAVNDKLDTLSNRIQPSAVIFKKENTSYSTLRELIQNHEFFKSSTAEEFIFGAEGFDDLPVTNWGFSIRLYTGGGNKYIIAYKMLSNDLFYTRSMNYDGTWASDWRKLCTTSVADVPVTTVDLTGTDIHGSVEYLVKSGICYVSAWGVSSDTAKTAYKLVKADVMPKPSIYSGTTLVHGDTSQNGKLVGQLYVDSFGGLSLHIYHNTIGNVGYGSFSYPVAEE